MNCIVHGDAKSWTRLKRLNKYARIVDSVIFLNIEVP